MTKRMKHLNTHTRTRYRPLYLQPMRKLWWLPHQQQGLRL
jgi:hypothetical protein